MMKPNRFAGLAFFEWMFLVASAFFGAYLQVASCYMMLSGGYMNVRRLYMIIFAFYRNGARLPSSRPLLHDAFGRLHEQSSPLHDYFRFLPERRTLTYNFPTKKCRSAREYRVGLHPGRFPIRISPSF